MDRSQSLASLRERPSQAKVRSTTQRRGKSSKPFVASKRLTISMVKRPRAAVRSELRALIAAVGEEVTQPRPAFQDGLQHDGRAVAIMDVGGVDDQSYP